MKTLNLRMLAVSSAVVLSSIAFVGCTTTRPQDQASSASSRTSIDAQVDASLSKLYDSVKGDGAPVVALAGGPERRAARAARRAGARAPRTRR